MTKQILYFLGWMSSLILMISGGAAYIQKTNKIGGITMTILATMFLLTALEKEKNRILKQEEQ